MMLCHIILLELFENVGWASGFLPHSVGLQDPYKTIRFGNYMVKTLPETDYI